MGEEGDDPDQHCGMEVQGALSSQVANLLVLFFVVSLSMQPLYVANAQDESLMKTAIVHSSKSLLSFGSMADMVQACMIQVVNSCVLNLGFVQELGIV